MSRIPGDRCAALLLGSAMQSKAMVDGVERPREKLSRELLVHSELHAIFAF